jgi:hypothetical protein
LAVPSAALLSIYRAQPHIERRFATLKGVIEAAPLTLKSDARIDALAICLYAALLVHALVERQIRRAMVALGVKDPPLHFEDCACSTPTAARIIEILEPLCTPTIHHNGEQLIKVPPALDPLQRQLLTLLKVPHSVYSQTRHAP